MKLPCARPVIWAGRASIILICALLAATFSYARPSLELAIEDAAGATLYSAPVHNGSEFAIRYTHSVALTPVTDYFFIRDNVIWLDKTEYRDFGAGLPHAPEPGQKMQLHNGTLSINGYERKLGTFQMRVGRVANHTLLLKTRQGWRKIPLSNISVPGSAITFAVRQTGNK